MRLSQFGLLAAATIAAVAAAAGDTYAAERTLRVSASTVEPCHTTWRGGQAGVATASVRVRGKVSVDAVLRARDGDWDLALFDADKRPVAAGASPGAREMATGLVLGGGTVLIQACRRAGEAETATVSLTHARLAKTRPEKIQLVNVKTPTRAHKNRLTRLGVDLTEHGHAGGVGVVLHGESDADLLRRNGFEWTVEVGDLVGRTIRDRKADRRFAATTTRSALPSGRDTYRTLADYENELKALAAQNPGLVRLFELPHKTWLGRTVIGIEISENVNLNDGKPAFANLGLHHAREWPSGEHAIEWAYELINGYKGGDPRATNIVRRSRNIVVPVVNPDGFDASRGAVGAPPEGRDESVDDTAYLIAGASNGGEYRRKNCRLPDNSEAAHCATSAGLAEHGVDPNRNYGGLWGGPGANTNPLTQSYRGPGPFSEPETRNIQHLLSRHQVMTLVTNHTTAGLVLRPPGLAALGDPPDEPIYKALGDAMAKENGYFSQKGFELYDTTGTTEDWSYYATGGLGFTFEIYCGEPDYDTGDCLDPAFHPKFETMVKEWDGTSPQADHVGDPRPGLGGYDGKGNREAYYLAAEAALDAAQHGVIEGEAPAGTTLRIRKTFKTATFPQGDPPTPMLLDDALESVYDVSPTGRVEWHVNPSTRPIVAKATGRAAEGPPSPPQELDGDLTGPPADGAAVACPTYFEVPGSCTSDSWNDHPFTFPVGGGTDNDTATVRFTFLESDDWDLEVYEDKNDNGVSDGPDGAPVATSGNGAFNATLGLEETTLPRPAATKKYVARMINFAAVNPGGYEGELKFNPPPPAQPAQREAWTLTCEKDGRVLETQQVFVDRGQRVPLNLPACAKALAASASTVAPPPDTCVAGGGFRSVAANRRSRGRRLALSFRRRVTRPVDVDVFQQSVGRRVIGERLVARFQRRSRGLTWNGRANRRGRRITDGYYFLRYTMALPGGAKDVRRVTLRRVRGRWTTRASFHRPDSCGVVRSYKLTRPVFGGRNNRELGIAFRLLRSARVRVDVLRGSRVVRRYRSTSRRAGITHRLRLTPRRLARGDYKFRLIAVEGGRTVRLTLTSRRL